MIVAGKRYRHYKGDTYEVITLSKDEATGEDVVVYRSESTKLVWNTPLARFMGHVDLPNGVGKRFVLIEEAPKVAFISNTIYSNTYGGLTFRVTENNEYEDKIIYTRKEDIPMNDAASLYNNYKAYILKNRNEWHDFEVDEL